MNTVVRTIAAGALGAGLVWSAGPAIAADLADLTTTTEDGFTVIVLDGTETGSTFTPKDGETTTGEPTSEPGPGDAFGFTDDLTQAGVLVGTDKGACTIVPDAKAKCAATFTFAKGTVSAAGVNEFTADGTPFTVTVTGGTGAYAGAKGTLTVLDFTDAKDPSDKLSTLTLKLATAAAKPPMSAPAETVSKATTSTVGGKTVLKAHEVETSSMFVPKGGTATKDFPDHEPAAGDAFTFVNDLHQGDTLVGTDAGGCTFVSAEAPVKCDVTVSLPGGTIHVVGDADGDAFTIPIASGTGAYAGITGSVLVVDHSGSGEDEDDSSDLTFTYSLPTSTQVTEVPAGGAATGGGGSAQSTDSALLIGVGVAAIAGAGGLFGAARFTGRRN